jgi:hypothetical protein
MADLGPGLCGCMDQISRIKMHHVEAECEYLDWFFSTTAYPPGAIAAKYVEGYVRAYSQSGAMRAGFAYHAACHQDGAQGRSWRETKLKMRVLGIDGPASIGPLVGARLKKVAGNVAAEVAPECGHWIPEDQPSWLAERLECLIPQKPHESPKHQVGRGQTSQVTEPNLNAQPSLFDCG